MGTNRDKWGRLPSLSKNDNKQPCWMRGCVFINGGANPLMRADIPMFHLESKEGSKFYSVLICEMMFSRFEHGMTETHLSPFHFVMAMQSPDNLHIYYYKDEYFETMQYLYECYYANNPEWGEYFLEKEKQIGKTPLLNNGEQFYIGKSKEVATWTMIDYTFYNHAFEFAKQQRWTPEYHNWGGVNKFNSELGHACFAFYETLDELLKVFNEIGIKAQKMKRAIDKKRRGIKHLPETDED
jgi:hypothetical protein